MEDILEQIKQIKFKRLSPEERRIYTVFQDTCDITHYKYPKHKFYMKDDDIIFVETENKFYIGTQLYNSFFDEKYIEGEGKYAFNKSPEDYSQMIIKTIRDIFNIPKRTLITCKNDINSTFKF